MNILYIIRGVPGSGKSTLAHKLTDNVVEADQFMYEDGEYRWHPSKLHMAHQKCKETVEKYMQEGRPTIAVANTFIKVKDYQPYVDLAKEYNYKVEIKVCEGNYQNVHNVPKETVEKMRQKFQESVCFDDLAYNSASEKFENLRIIKNPSINWIQSELEKNDLRFIYNPLKNILYVWNGNRWIHGDVMDNVDLRLSDKDIIGVLGPKLVELWAEISPSEDENEAISLTKKYFGEVLKQIYPSGYNIRVYS